MLKVLSKQEISRHVGFAYALSQNAATSSYPSFRDGIKTEAHFVAAANRAGTDDSEQVLLFTDGNKARGWLQYYFSDEHTINIYTFLCDGDYTAMLREFTGYVARKFGKVGSGSHHCLKVCVGIPKENAAAYAALSVGGFELLETSYNNVIALEKYTPTAPDANITAVTKDDYDKFKALHDGVDIYYDSDRIAENFSSWTILLYDDGQRKAAIYCLDENILWEVFGIDYANDEYDVHVCESLVNALCAVAKARGVKHLAYFTETEKEKACLNNIGFATIDEYCYFEKLL